MSSLKSRLNLGFFVISLLFLTALITVNIIFFNKFGEEFVETRLQHDTDALLAALKPDEQGKLQLDELNLNPIFLQPFSGHYYRIELDHAVFQSRSLWDKTMTLERLPVGETHLYQDAGPIEQKLLKLEGSYLKSDQNIWISVSEDYTPITNSLQSLTVTLAFLNGAIILIVILFQRIIVNRGMEPLKRTTEELSLLGAGEKYFLNEKVPEEVLPLVKEINKLLVMVDNRIKRSTTALGNLAHALKTPLSFIEQSISGERQNFDRQTLGEIKKATKQIHNQLNNELRRARIIGSSVHGQKINMLELITPLVETLNTIYREKNLSFNVKVDPDVVFVGDRHDMMELLGNLLDNACKWAAETVAVEIKDDNGLSITIEDDGPGITEEMVAKIEQRGTRIDESGDGHGLGLSIVREIIDLNNASHSYTRSQTYGGLKVLINIPNGV